MGVSAVPRANANRQERCHATAANRKKGVRDRFALRVERLELDRSVAAWQVIKERLGARAGPDAASTVAIALLSRGTLREEGEALRVS